MSGGHFNYVCFEAEENPFKALPDLRNMETCLRSHNKQLAADEVLKYILMIETAQHRLEVAHKHFNNLLFAVEWWASGDWGEEDVDRAYDEMIKGKE